MMKFKFLLLKKISVAIAILFLCNVLVAQTSKSDPNDFQGWYGAGVKIDLPKKWEVNINYQSRFINNMKTYNGSYITLGGSKKISRQLTALADYRLVLADNGLYHRFSIGSEAERKLSKFDLNFRLLVQSQLQDFDELEKANDDSGYWRIRFQAKTSLTKKLNLYVSTEPIMKFGGNYFIDNIRNTIGLKYKISDNTKIDLFYIYRPDFAKTTYNRLFQVVGINIDFNFKVKKQ
jgi:hypothetical protein